TNRFRAWWATARGHVRCCTRPCPRRDAARNVRINEDQPESQIIEARKVDFAGGGGPEVAVTPRKFFDLKPRCTYPCRTLRAILTKLATLDQYGQNGSAGITWPAVPQSGE